MHVEVCVTGADDRDFGLEELGQSGFPFVGAGWMAETGVEEDEGVEVRVVGREGLRGVQRVEVLDVSGDFHLAAEPVFDDGAPGVGRRAGR